VYVYLAPRAEVISGAHQQLRLDGRCTDIDVAHAYMSPQQQLSELRPTAANTLESMMIKRDFGTSGPYPTVHIFSRWYQRRFTSSPSRSSTVPPPSSSTSPIPGFDQKYPHLTQANNDGTHSECTVYDIVVWETPETPILHASNTTPSASSVSPATPAIVVELSAQIALSPGMLIRRDKPSPIHP
jgi:hypothetical protein